MATEMNANFDASPTEIQRSTEHSLLLEREALFQLSADLMLICSLDGKLLGANPAAKRTLGSDIDHLLEMEWLNSIHPRVGALGDCLRHQSGSIQWETETVTPDGESQWIHWACTIDRENDRAYFVGRDLTDQQMLAKELSRGEHELYSVMSGARCALWQADVVDVGGELDWVLEFRDPEAAREFLGFDVPPGVSYDLAFDLAKLEEDLPHMRIATADELAAGLRHYQQEYRIRTSNGEIRWIS